MLEWMDEHLNWLLVALFTAHLVPFTWLSIRRRTWGYWSTLLTFALLVMLNWMRAVGASPEVMGVSVQSTLRALAIGFALLTVARLIRARWPQRPR